MDKMRNEGNDPVKEWRLLMSRIEQMGDKIGNAEIEEVLQLFPRVRKAIDENPALSLEEKTYKLALLDACVESMESIGRALVEVELHKSLQSQGIPPEVHEAVQEVIANMNITALIARSDHSLPDTPPNLP
ncbi:hypothetical protein HY732_02100 [Candidatus Uhrbacteria bacterium]|nr:hypothetical protein [Candidatus Uhrbacteria bacterium]